MPELIEVLEFLDNTGSVMVKRVPDNGPTEIKWGAQLTVRDSQEAIFFRDGQVVDVFAAGRYVLETRNFPVITKWVTSFAYGPNSPFRAEVYFTNKKLFTNLKWGTAEPMLFADTELKMIRLRAFGVFSLQIADSRVFVNQIVGTIGLYTDNDIADYLKNIIIAKLTEVLGTQAKTVTELPSRFANICDAVKAGLQSDFQNIGLRIADFTISSISVPEDVQAMIDQRSGMSAIGNMDEFMKYKMAMSMEDAAKNPGNIASQTLGAGVGMGMGFMLPKMVQQSMTANDTPVQSENRSAIEKLKDLKGLLDLGIITQAEFDQKKAQLLTLI